jgi:ribosomal RNA-processing protein 12
VLYGSESEDEDEDEENESNAHTKTLKKASEYGARIRADDDDPMDLLSGAASRVTSEPFKQHKCFI